jgi:hypothetical protein
VNLPPQIVLDLPRAVDPSFARALSTRVIESASSPWEESFALLERHAA